MIDIIHTKLSIWGAWVRTGARKGLGYPSVSPMFMDMPSSGVFESKPPVGAFTGNDEIEETNTAVLRLEQDDRALLIEFYVISGTAISVAERLSMTRRTLYNKLHIAQNKVMGNLHDIYAGL